MGHVTSSSYGLWTLVIVNSLVFIVFAFSFAKPQSARDWRSFGAFSGFIVALFAEMYGYPLTIYLLSGWLGSRFPGVDFLAHDAGHLLEVMLGWRANPHFGPFHLLSYAFIGGGFWLLSTAWRVLYANQRRGTLVTTGAYARIRHPQYVGFVLILFGFLLQWPTLLTLAMFPVLVFMYVRLAISEEREAARTFGDEWWMYAGPDTTFSSAVRPSAGASMKQVLRHPMIVQLIASTIVATTALAWSVDTSAQSSGPATSSTQTSRERGVTVKVTPRVASGTNSWEFAVVLDTHSEDLTDDLMTTALLLADGRELRPVQWTGTTPGGHHREGVLKFVAPEASAGSIELRIQRVGEAAPRVFRWDAAVWR